MTFRRRTRGGCPRQGGDGLPWAQASGTARTDEECHRWNRFIVKLGWRDERSTVLPRRIMFKRATGVPPSQYQIKLRKDAARRFLCETKKS
jgi:hypothetical protein